MANTTEDGAAALGPAREHRSELALAWAAIAQDRLALAGIAGLPREHLRVRPGEPAPDFTLLDADSEPFTLSASRGHPVLIKFFRGHW